MEIYCTVASGLGEGGKFVSMPEYNRAFTDKLGFVPFPGTLNLLPEGDGKAINKNVMEKAMNVISSFDRDGNHYGGLWASKCQIVMGLATMQCYVVVPEIDKHRGVLEIVAPFCIRTSYDLKDGDRVKLVM